MEHLLNNYIVTSWVWDAFASIFQQTDRDNGSIIETLINWRHNFSDLELLGSVWVLTLGFIIWILWKERNNRISKNVKSSPQFLFEQILRHLKEIVSTIVRSLPKNPPSAMEMQILLKLGLQGFMLHSLDNKVSRMESKLDYQHPPPQGFLKFRIDGASKDNPGNAGCGGVLRDDNGSLLYIFHCHLGRATNNMLELLALEQCLKILKRNNIQNVIIEVDSELIIKSVKRISYGTEPKKVSKYWRLL